LFTDYTTSSVKFIPKPVKKIWGEDKGKKKRKGMKMVTFSPALSPSIAPSEVIESKGE